MLIMTTFARKDKRLCLYTENLEDLRIYLVSVAIRILVKTELRARRHGALGYGKDAYPDGLAKL